MKSIFDERYRVPPARRSGDAASESERLAAREIQNAGMRYLAAMRARPGRPKSMAYFEDIITGPGRLDEIAAFRKAGGKVIGLFCDFVPEELVLAAGALPVRLCSGAFPAVAAAEEVLARDVCPLVKSSFGLALMRLSYAGMCDLVIMPTSCDAKKKCSKFLDSIVPTWTLDLPQSKDYDKNLGIWTREIQALVEKLEAFCGRRIRKDALADSIRLIHRRTEAFRRFHEMKKADPGILSGRDTLLAIQASFYDDAGRWTEKFGEMTAELGALKRADAAADAQPAPRIMLTGAPVIWPNWKLLDTIEESGALVAADTLCSGTQRLFDPVEVDEWTSDGMMRALAAKHLFPSICPCFIENAEHIDRILELAQDFRIDGVIYHTVRLCQLFDMEYNHISAVLKSRNIPLLNIVTDLSLEDEGQIRTRVEAFLEMIGNRIQ